MHLFLSTTKATKRSKFIFVLHPFNSFHATSFFLWPLQTLKSQSFFNVSRGYRKRPMALNDLNFNDSKHAMKAL